MGIDSAFRSWVRLLWIENCEERLSLGEPKLPMSHYWCKYKWWIKREYKHYRNTK
jgi:hypothetical protein